MATHLLAVSLGPVQEFIAQARRTRDLWYGSRLLSKLSRVAARALASHGQLIFPAPQQLHGNSTGVANKVLALVEGEPRELASKARQAARSYLAAEWRRVHTRHTALLAPGALEAAQEQIDTLLEFHAAWAACGEAPEDYARARQQVEEALGARKRLHAFAPWKDARRVHKSSLDGARGSVLVTEGAARQGGDWQRFRINPREQLDAIGLLKRTRGSPGQFVPVPTIGLVDWVLRAGQADRQSLDELRQACEQLAQEHRALTPVRREGLEWLQHFPFDGQLLLPERWPTYFEDCGIADPSGAAQRLRAPLARLYRAVGEPFPYVACLVADGDRMGSALDRLASQGSEAHRALSDALSRFSEEARHLVERHQGVLVYAGGDDVLAFICPAQALRCAQELRQAFESHVRSSVEGMEEKERPTLSVGLGIGHVLESLAHLLELGRQAERDAKEAGRNALALRVARHSGRELRWATSWRSEPARLLGEARALLEQGLPLKKVHELEELCLSMPPPKELKGEESEWRRLLEREARRLLARAEPGGELRMEEVRLGLEGVGTYAECLQRLRDWALRVQVAETLRRAGWTGSTDTGGKA